MILYVILEQNRKCGEHQTAGRGKEKHTQKPKFVSDDVIYPLPRRHKIPQQVSLEPLVELASDCLELV